MMKRYFSQSLILLVFLLAGKVQMNAQCTGSMVVPIVGSGTGVSLSVTESHVDAVCPGGNGSVTISATGGTTPYTGTGTFLQPVGTQSYTVIDMVGCMFSISVTITFTDAVPPSITCPAPVTVSPGPGLCTATGVMLGVPTTSDNCGIAGTSNNAPTIYNQGVTTVIWTTTDVSGNSSTCAQTVTVTPCITISGNIKWENNNAPVKDATVTLNTLPGPVFLNSIPTDVNGNYTLTAGPSGNYQVKPTKNLFLLNGVTSADATRIQQHIVNNPPLIGPYKRIAADVNKSNSISTIDAQLITQAIAGNPTALAIFNTSWRFVPSTYVFPTPNTPWGFPESIDLTGISTSQINKNFIGVKIGDVNGTANPLLKPGAPVVWTVADQVLKAGETIEVTFNANQFIDVAAYEFALGFDPSELEYSNVQSSGALEFTEDNFGAFNSKNGEFRAVWSAPLGKTLGEGTGVFTIQFKALESGSKLSDVLFIDEQELPAKAYNTDLVETSMALLFKDATVSGLPNPALQMELQLLQNRPNPFMDQTTIGFILPAACDAQLRIFDINGKLVTEINKAYPAGYQQERIEVKGQSGVLYYELTTPFGVLSKKMIITK